MYAVNRDAVPMFSMMQETCGLLSQEGATQINQI